VSVRVLLADDERLVRTGFRMILKGEADLDVIGEAGDGLEVIRVIEELRPDVVLMDIRMPVMDGVEATRRILAEARTSPDDGTDDGTDGETDGGPRVLVLTTFDLDELVLAALEAGASGFLLKDSPPEELVRGIHLVAAGDALLAPSITRRVIEHFTALRATAGTSRAAREAVARLTDRERDVLRHLARGLSNTEIARTMYVTESTVKTHVGRIFTKLGARERVQAAVTAYDAGLVRPGSG